MTEYNIGHQFGCLQSPRSAARTPSRGPHTKGRFDASKTKKIYLFGVKAKKFKEYFVFAHPFLHW